MNDIDTCQTLIVLADRVAALEDRLDKLALIETFNGLKQELSELQSELHAHIAHGHPSKGKEDRP